MGPSTCKQKKNTYDYKPPLILNVLIRNEFDLL